MTTAVAANRCVTPQVCWDARALMRDWGIDANGDQDNYERVSKIWRLTMQRVADYGRPVDRKRLMQFYMASATALMLQEG